MKTTALSESFNKLAATEIQMRQEFSEKMVAMENIDQVICDFLLFIWKVNFLLLKLKS